MKLKIEDLTSCLSRRSFGNRVAVDRLAVVRPALPSHKHQSDAAAATGLLLISTSQRR